MKVIQLQHLYQITNLQPPNPAHNSRHPSSKLMKLPHYSIYYQLTARTYRIVGQTHLPSTSLLVACISATNFWGFLKFPPSRVPLRKSMTVLHERSPLCVIPPCFESTWYSGSWRLSGCKSSYMTSLSWLMRGSGPECMCVHLRFRGADRGCQSVRSVGVEATMMKTSSRLVICLTRWKRWISGWVFFKREKGLLTAVKQFGEILELRRNGNWFDFMPGLCSG